jgi:biopolymer transport protein ExbD
MKLTRSDKPRNLISLVPMIDVMLIMLVFFMVTSTYLNLDMIPVFERPEDTTTDIKSTGNSSDSKTLLIRLNSSGVPYYLGRSFDQAQLGKLVQEMVLKEPLTKILVFPSNHATTQSLVTLMDTVTKAGSTNLRIVRLEDTQ